MFRRTNLSMPPRERTDLNMTRRLRRFIRVAGLPLTGPAHQLRMDFVRATHALCILQRSCTRDRVLQACCELLDGWAEREEHHSREGGYQHRLLNAVDELHSRIEQWAWADDQEQVAPSANALSVCASTSIRISHSI